MLQYINFWLYSYAKFVEYSLHDMLGQCNHLVACGMAKINQYKGLTLVYSNAALSISLHSRLVNKPSCGNFASLLR